MKRFLFAAVAACLAAFPLPAQNTAGGSRPDEATIRRQIESDNAAALSRMAASPVVVAAQTVPRKDFQLWYSCLPDKTWGADGNWYPFETQELFLSIAGEEGDKNIVGTMPIEGGLWSRPVVVGGTASPGQEIFPMPSADGRRLYFSSDGLSGMGGYDLYVVERESPDMPWSAVRNLGVPFNSTGDDLLFCEASDGRFCLLASNRSCGKDSVTIYVMRQEVAVYAPVTPEEARDRSRLAVTAPDPAWQFTKHHYGSVPAIRFEEAEERVDDAFRVGGEGSFAKGGLPSGLVYQIQLFVTGNKVTTAHLKGVSPVYAHLQKSGKTMYAAGCWRKYAEAESALTSVKRAGFASAFIVAFQDGRPLSLSKARKQEAAVKVVSEEIRIVTP